MARTLSYDQGLIQFGLVLGLAVNVRGREAQTVSKAPIVQASITVDPFEQLFGRYDDDPSWEDFPGWLKEYRASAPRDLA